MSSRKEFQGISADRPRQFRPDFAWTGRVRCVTALLGLTRPVFLRFQATGIASGYPQPSGSHGWRQILSRVLQRNVTSIVTLQLSAPIGGCIVTPLVSLP